MSDVNKGRGKNTRFREYSRVSSLEGRLQRLKNRQETMGRDNPAEGLKMHKPGSMNVKKVGR